MVHHLEVATLQICLESIIVLYIKKNTERLSDVYFYDSVHLTEYIQSNRSNQTQPSFFFDLPGYIYFGNKLFFFVCSTYTKAQ